MEELKLMNAKLSEVAKEFSKLETREAKFVCSILYATLGAMYHENGLKDIADAIKPVILKRIEILKEEAG